MAATRSAPATEDAAQSSLPSSSSPALKFQVVAQQGRARTALMELPHFTAETPMFMPVGTRGTVKGLTSQQLEELRCQVILGNTYHLEDRPGSDLIEQMGGLHKFMNWPRAMLTDSGGFQMVSLLHLADITEEGVTFRSPVDGRRMLLTPEQSMAIQNRLGADIMMALDDVVPATTTDPKRFEEATHRTTRWIDRCIKAHSRPTEQNLFAIVQGGLDPSLREASLEGLTARDKDLPGYAIGGLAGGEDKDDFWKMVSQSTAGLPPGKPRYVMGIGYPLDIVVCSALGADMYDSVYPTRTARFGVALVPEGVMKLRNNLYEQDFRPIDEKCDCLACQRYTRAYMHDLATKGINSVLSLISMHNIAYMMRLTKEIREAIKEQRYPEYVQEYMSIMFPKGDVPQWVMEALEAAGISLDVRPQASAGAGSLPAAAKAASAVTTAATAASTATTAPAAASTATPAAASAPAATPAAASASTATAEAAAATIPTAATATAAETNGAAEALPLPAGRPSQAADAVNTR